MKRKSLSEQLNTAHLTKMILTLVLILLVNFIVLNIFLNKHAKLNAITKGTNVKHFIDSRLAPALLDGFDDLNSNQQVEALRNLLPELNLNNDEGVMLFFPEDSALYIFEGARFTGGLHAISDEEYADWNYNEKDSLLIKKDIVPFLKRSYVYVNVVGHSQVALVYFFAPESLLYSLGRYPMIMTLFVAFLIIVLSWRIHLSNKKISKPYSEIVKLIEHNQDVMTISSTILNESMLIRRAVDLYHNQLSFYKKNLEKASSQTTQIEKDIRIARRLQKNILPKEPEVSDKTHHVTINAQTDTFFDIGGDLYDYFMIDDKHLLFLIGDVSGKGIPAALFMIYVQTLLRSLVSKETNPGTILTRLNEKILEENVSDLFVTIFIGVLNCKTHELLYSNAAHNLPLFIESDGNISPLETTHGIPVGLYKDKIYSFSKIKLKPNSLIVLFTDGLVDTLDENGQNYSVDILKYNLMGSWFLTSHEVVEKIQKSIESFRGNSPKVDDMTIMALKVDE